MAIATEQLMRGMFAQIVAGALIDSAVEPPENDAERRSQVAVLLEIAVDVFDERGDHATAETLRGYAHAVQHASVEIEELGRSVANVKGIEGRTRRHIAAEIRLYADSEAERTGWDGMAGLLGNWIAGIRDAALVAAGTHPKFRAELPEVLAEEGRWLASEREDLIAEGIDPAALAVPAFPHPEEEP